ncbi:hypothetical protein Y032_0766g2176 [Ancylostoma ceylanicum]|nr:hypothetical protein Y032_0766g2176 [Ancylostoma ceylanicum]
MIGGLSYTRKRSRRARLRNSWNFARGHHLNSSFKVLQFYFSILKHLPHYTLKNGGPLFQGKDDRFTLIGIDSGHVGNAEEAALANQGNTAKAADLEMTVSDFSASLPCSEHGVPGMCS